MLCMPLIVVPKDVVAVIYAFTMSAEEAECRRNSLATIQSALTKLSALTSQT